VYPAQDVASERTAFHCTGSTEMSQESRKSFGEDAAGIGVRLQGIQLDA